MTDAMTMTTPPNTRPMPPTPPVPGAHHDDDSIAGEEDPGAGADNPTESEPVRREPAPPPA